MLASNPSLKQYRSEMGVIADILGIMMEGGREGMITSGISRRANLSYYAMIEKCQKLIRAGLIQPMRAGRTRLFRMTEKGVWLLQFDNISIQSGFFFSSFRIYSFNRLIVS